MAQTEPLYSDGYKAWMQQSTIKKFIFLFACALAMSLVAVMGLYIYLRQVHLENKTPMHFVLAPGETIGHIARRLQKVQVLLFPERLILLAYLERCTRHIQAGEYEFPPHVRLDTLLKKLVDGKVILHDFTIVEGWTIRQLLQALAKESNIKHTQKKSDAKRLMTIFGEPTQNPEGWFFPDTYFYAKGQADIDILRDAYHRMQKELNHQWQVRGADLPFKSDYEALITASLIEKETAFERERPIIASVIVKRLNIGMRLQIDAAVIYGLGPSFKGPLRRSDLQRKTAYNTYIKRGLPPSPIAIPSLSALSAALHPAVTNALYYVSKGDGTHQFSATLEGQRQAIKRYLLQPH